MSKKKKPDNVVFNEADQKYDASLKTYATNLGAPQITSLDTTAWKNRSINKVNHKIKTKFSELQNAYEAMLKEYEYNQLIYQSKFSFEPVVGETYHLYRRKNSETFLSIIAPHQCNFDFVGSFKLNADSIWERVENKDDK
ncbi:MULTISPECIES: DUF2452 domain-containing protein [Croceibacter]|jgi:hypothetical protein|uniref:DUF2452 domain-containing protein n=1 Tax=Croceibacter TaxID=216431 RepID=UPI000C54B238|nr:MULTISPECIES: DUF2452 domain-containing protein [Croceibacter]MBG24955.1 GTP-binding protein [Croceibacter sp.]WSP34444.1 DUF2452 domain-containing protein [Croceibacter atlanticus]HAT70592.1 DUF2452 domain-containing protein [Flavobacteriaceae bacterium]|tara:strand:- start:686 stop:1105 length:420 start_codon:yes stop_codon:yes gene_type:complete